MATGRLLRSYRMNDRLRTTAAVDKTIFIVGYLSFATDGNGSHAEFA
jgi:hypothetical protein